MARDKKNKKAGLICLPYPANQIDIDKVKLAARYGQQKSHQTTVLFDHMNIARKSLPPTGEFDCWQTIRKSAKSQDLFDLSKATIAIVNFDQLNTVPQ